jgi:hypothetical protein
MWLAESAARNTTLANLLLNLSWCLPGIEVAVSSCESGAYRYFNQGEDYGKTRRDSQG